MVKLTSGNHLISLVVNKLHAIKRHAHDETLDSLRHVENPDLLQVEEENKPASVASGLVDIIREALKPLPDLEFWDTQSRFLFLAISFVCRGSNTYFNAKTAIVRSLRPPERDSRLEQIEERAGHSFEWVFDRPEIGLVPWLHNGRGLFWISGRPGSGKSTMMKFIHNDPRTRRAMEKWEDSGQQICASFFFHHRGNAAQKSFHGLLASILSQIMENEPRALNLVLPIFQERYQTFVRTESLGSLQEDVADFIAKLNITVSHMMMEDLRGVLGCESPHTRFREIVERPLFSTEPNGSYWRQVKKTLVSHINYEVEEILLSRKPRKQTLRQARDSQVSSICLELAKERWDNETKSHFYRAVLDWRTAVDLDHHLQNLARHSKPQLSETERLGPGEQSTELVLSQIRTVLRRQKKRNDRRALIEIEEWTLLRLSSALKAITKQDVFDLDLCLFLDALDEYDGRSEFISEFLRDLIKGQEDSRTHIRIVFSSRPWDVFVQDFGNCPGFKIHEHTENDMRELCACSIQAHSPAPKELIQLIGEIVQRARGVFLWVRLVLSDMIPLALQYGRAGERGKLVRDKLLAVLGSLPDDLASYYQSIIERIPLSFRLQTYILLEAVCRSTSALLLHEVPLLLYCSTINKLTKHQTAATDVLNSFGKDVAGILQTASGGLIEVVGIDGQLQLLHQTMFEFIEQPQFKQIVLRSQSHIVEENGHSFLAKYRLCRNNGMVTPEFLRHAFQSERTAGISLHSFVSGSSTLRFELKVQLDAMEIVNLITLLGLAITGCLRLLLRDILDDNIAAVKTCKEPLSSMLFWSLENEVCNMPDIMSTVHFIQSHGWDLRKDHEGIRQMLTRHRYNAKLTQVEADLFFRLLLDKVENVDISISHPYDGLETKWLHYSSLGLAQYLLSRGADPNSLDSAGSTPLDILIFCKELGMQCSSQHEMHQHIRLLLNHGGAFNTTRPDSWKLQEVCNKFLIDTRLLRWMSAAEPASSSHLHDTSVDSDDEDEVGGGASLQGTHYSID